MLQALRIWECRNRQTVRVVHHRLLRVIVREAHGVLDNYDLDAGILVPDGGPSCTSIILVVLPSPLRLELRLSRVIER